MQEKDKEYEILMKEIEQRVSIIYDNIKVLYVSLTAVLAWAITNNEPLMCLLGYCIIIPSYNIVMDYYIGVLRIGAYINVFYEEYPWERRLQKVNIATRNDINRYDSAYKTPHIFSSIMCLCLTLILTDFNSITLRNIIVLIVSLLVSVFFLLFVNKQKSNDETIKLYIDEYAKINEGQKNEPQNISDIESFNG